MKKESLDWSDNFIKVGRFLINMDNVNWIEKKKGKH